MLLMLLGGNPDSCAAPTLYCSQAALCCLLTWCLEADRWAVLQQLTRREWGSVAGRWKELAPPVPLMHLLGPGIVAAEQLCHGAAPAAWVLRCSVLGSRSTHLPCACNLAACSGGCRVHVGRKLAAADRHQEAGCPAGSCFPSR